jgi:hypothetical protein
MKIFYASSMSGMHSKHKTFFDEKIVEHLLHHGVVNGGYIINGLYNPASEADLNDKEIHDLQLNWLWQSDTLIAEVSNPSLGVGYILGRALEFNKKTLCLFRPSDKKLSAMIRGSRRIKTFDYKNVEEAISIIDDFLDDIVIRTNHTSTIAEINKSTFHDLITVKVH